jgi:hypothetical protein
MVLAKNGSATSRMPSWTIAVTLVIAGAAISREHGCDGPAPCGGPLVRRYSMERSSQPSRLSAPWLALDRTETRMRSNSERFSSPPVDSEHPPFGEVWAGADEDVIQGSIGVDVCRPEPEAEATRREASMWLASWLEVVAKLTAGSETSAGHRPSVGSTGTVKGGEERTSDGNGRIDDDPIDAGPADAAPADAGQVDAAPTDAASADAGLDATRLPCSTRVDVGDPGCIVSRGDGPPSQGLVVSLECTRCANGGPPWRWRGEEIGFDRDTVIIGIDFVCNPRLSDPLFVQYDEIRVMTAESMARLTTLASTNLVSAIQHLDEFPSCWQRGSFSEGVLVSANTSITIWYHPIVETATMMFYLPAANPSWASYNTVADPAEAPPERERELVLENKHYTMGAVYRIYGYSSSTAGSAIAPHR